MKTAGLSSKVKKAQRHTAKAGTFANLQAIHLRIKEREKLLQAQMARAALLEKQKQERESQKLP